ncbi:MAG: xanthine dehydrogenase accessory protein XdhC [SAR324 cluster bacterium]|nr:xanthine dehydrogenase accessory protein XdhC [SAR324 cluster bacterium]
MDGYLKKLSELLQDRTPTVSVILVDTAGSTPQDRGSKMLITEAGLAFGTIGGGRIEHLAIETGQAMLSEKSVNQKTRFVEWSLNKEAGMTCGGGVKLFFEVFSTNEWKIAIFGAGHLANALIPLLLNLDCQITCLDSREEWLAKLPSAPSLELVHSNDLTKETDLISKDTFVLLMTKGHGTDLPILQKFLERGQQPYLGVIGSKSKAAVLRRELRNNGLPEEKCNEFFCPVGMSIGTNHPFEIAISIASQLVAIRDKVL